MTLTSDVVIVGGGVAAARCALSLRELGHAGRLTMLSEEPVLPYDRPPLSKDVLRAEDPRDPTCLLPRDVAEQLDIDVRLGHRAVGLDTQRRLVTVEHQGDAVPYDKLVVATGTRARTLPALSGLAGIHHLRTAHDAESIRAALRPGASVTIVGAGFIGLEVASTARDHGCEVTIVEVADHPLAPVLGERLASWLQGWHADQGAHFRCGVSIDQAQSRDGTITLSLSDGTEVTSDVVVVGVGVHRDVAWLTDSGVQTHVGLVCDSVGRTSIDGIYGAGDVMCVHEGQTCTPVQHWTAASESAQRAARSILGLDPEPELDEHYFWSDQAGLRLVSVGGRTAGAELEIVSGELSAGKFVAHWTKGGRVVGVVGANSAKDFLQGRLAYRAAAEATSARA